MQVLTFSYIPYYSLVFLKEGWRSYYLFSRGPFLLLDGSSCLTLPASDFQISRFPSYEVGVS